MTMKVSVIGVKIKRSKPTWVFFLKQILPTVPFTYNNELITLMGSVHSSLCKLSVSHSNVSLILHVLTQ